MSISNVELENIAKFYRLKLNGIVMKDELEGMEPENGGYIVNLQSSSQGNGTHWCGLFIRGNNACYFDSFGGPAPMD
eukprot:gene34223-44209_t